ncbi:MAG: MFS transporter [Anaerolineaceae bacterium]|jgi:PAT family beta-lactamase induction signal transducer AmpG
MPKSKPIRLILFASLYFTQGTILGYFSSLNALYLLDNGLTMTDVGIFGMIALIPFVLKIFLGMLSDRVNLFGRGHRVPYILIGLAVQLACLLIVPMVDPSQQYWVFVALAFLLQLGMALYDTCTDGLALDTTPVEEQGQIQAFMVGGRAIGTIVAASLVGLLAQYVSWSVVFWSLAILTLIPLPFVLMVREPERTAGERFDWKAFSAFKRWPVIAVGLQGLLVFMVIVGAQQQVNPFLTSELDVSLSQIGMITSLWGVGIVLGSMVASALMKKLPVRNAFFLMLLAIGVSLASLSFFVRAQFGLELAIGLVVLYGIAYGIGQTISFAMCMRVVDSRIAASMFAILMAFTNVGQGIGLALSGALADAVGFRITLLVFAVIPFLVLPLFPTLFKQKEAAVEQ